jgi:signal peptide peptidase SppA
VVVLPVRGLILPKADAWFGGVALDTLARALRQAAADAGVSAIVLDVDSPGGSVFGVEEAAQALAAVRTRKPVAAVANPLAASAAYWLASQAGELVVAPGGQVGSVGVVAIHDDVSKATEKAGVRRSFVYAGRHKIEGHEFAPLEDPARAHLQEMVDAYYAKFVGDVARGRRADPATVRTRFGQGRMVRDDVALASGMADRIDTLHAAIARLAGHESRGSTVGVDTETARRRLPAELAGRGVHVSPRRTPEQQAEIDRRRAQLAKLGVHIPAPRRS